MKDYELFQVIKILKLRITAGSRCFFLLDKPNVNNV